MAKEKIYYPKTIEDTPFPLQEGAVQFDIDQKTSNDKYGAKEVKSGDFPTRRVAYELLGSALNTRSRKILAEFEFTQTGAIQIGDYKNGESGDLRISPNGIVARDPSGLTTFAIDGTTGNAVFKGEVQAGTFISGLVVVGDNNLIMDGEAIRFIVNDDYNDRVLIGKF